MDNHGSITFQFISEPADVNYGGKVHGGDFEENDYEKKTDCVIVFVAVDKNGKPSPVKKWVPGNDHEVKMEKYAKKLKSLQDRIQQETSNILNKTAPD